MKKLTGMKKNFSSLENKKMKNTQNILGGLAEGSSDYTNVNTSSPGCTDSVRYRDGKKVSTTWIGDGC